MGERDHPGSLDRFDARRPVDRVDEHVVRDVIRSDDREFIERMDMFFLATADAGGQPQCSYKGGEPGFVRVIDEHTLAFPNYDGHGMCLSLANVLVNAQVGMLLVDFVSERPSRMRIEGSASIAEHNELAWEYPEAQFVVMVRVQRVYPNCPRYIHRMALVERAPHLPRSGRAPPLPADASGAPAGEAPAARGPAADPPAT